MSTSTIKENIIYGLGEGGNVADATTLTYALRWANTAYHDIFLRYRFRNIQKRSIFRTANGQQTYQAPSDFFGFLTLKDESNDNVLDQLTPQDFSREVSPVKITNEIFVSDDGVAVSLANRAILQFGETVADDADQTTIYTRDTDYTIDYEDGTITVDAAQAMSDATTYYVSYQHYIKGKPDKFCLEYDTDNGKFVFRLAVTPDAIYIASLVYPAFPSDLSGSVNPIWDKFEHVLERGGIYYGSLELFESTDKMIERHEKNYETALAAIVQMDQDLVPKGNTIPVRMRRQDYTDNLSMRNRDRRTFTGN